MEAVSSSVDESPSQMTLSSVKLQKLTSMDMNRNNINSWQMFVLSPVDSVICILICVSYLYIYAHDCPAGSMYLYY